jgi:uncharacterized protein with ATP-grasp and redox domains
VTIDRKQPLTTETQKEARFEPFSLLKDPKNYVACSWDLKLLPERRVFWLDLFRRHFPKLLQEANRVELAKGESEDAVTKRLNEAQQLFYAFLDRAETEPDRLNRLDILAICAEREHALRSAGIDDPYLLAKQRENESALLLLPRLIRAIDSLEETERWERLVRGIFAGNLFDMGAVKAAEKFEKGGVDFFATQSELKPRPWLIDDCDAFISRIEKQPPYRAACLFVDNAGFDIVLGILPFARELLKRGTKVMLASNSAPSLNDITHRELIELVQRISDIDDRIAQAYQKEELVLLESGCITPLIDLNHIPVELCRAVERFGVDLIVIEGMGRALESNFDAQFTCDALKIAMIKSSNIAHWLGGTLYDLVIKYER